MIAAGKVESVLQREIHGVHSLGCHPPFAAVHRLVQFGQLPAILEQLGALLISEGVPFDDLKPGVIHPIVGITDPDLERAQFALRFCLGLRRHPGERIDAPGECFYEVADHRLHLGLRLSREVPLHISLPHSLAERCAGEIHAPLPPRAQFQNSAEGLTVKLEPLFDEGFGHEYCVLPDGMKRQPVLPDVERLPGREGGKPGNRLRMPDDE